MRWRTANLNQWRKSWMLSVLFLGIVASPGLAVNAMAAPGTLTEFPIPSGEPYPGTITSGSNDLWFTESYNAIYRIGRVTPDGQVTELSVPDFARGITQGPDGNIWFTMPGANPTDPGKIGRMAPDGHIAEFTIATPDGHPMDITVGPDGDLWFTETSFATAGVHGIGRITTNGQITEFSTLSPERHPEAITAGPDGNVWFTDPGSSSQTPSEIGQITPSGEIIEFLIPGKGRPTSIVTGPDNNVWFTESNGKVGRITPRGKITEFSVPLNEYGGQRILGGITSGFDGRLWIIDSAGGVLWRITPSGLITQFKLPLESWPVGIAAGQDGNIWYTTWTGGFEGGGGTALAQPVKPGKVGRITPDLWLDITNARVSAVRTRTKLGLACQGGEKHSACSGQLRLSIRINSQARHRKTLILGYRSYTVSSGATRFVAVHLSHRALVLLDRHPRLHMRVTATVRNGQTMSRRIILRRR